MNKLILTILLSATVFLLLMALFINLWAPRVQINRRISSFGKKPSRRRRKDREKKLLGKLTLLNGQDFIQKLSDELFVAGIKLRPEEFLTIWWVGGLVIPLLLRFLGLSAITSIGLVVIGVAAPVIYLHLKKESVLKQFDNQLLDALTIICNSLRAGFSFQTAAENVSKELPDPIAREFRMVSREFLYGIPMEDSLANLVRRTKNQDLELIVNAVIIQKKVGGNLANILDNISDTIKQRIQLRGDIKVMTSSGRVSGGIIGALPIFLLVMLMILNPTYIEDFISTSTGRIMLMIGAGMEIAGFIVVNRIVSIKM